MGVVEAEALVAARTKEMAAVIDVEEFERDRDDPEWREFLENAEEHLDELERDGRDR